MKSARWSQIDFSGALASDGRSMTANGSDREQAPARARRGAVARADRD